MEMNLSNINTAFKNFGYGEDFDIRDVASVDFDESAQTYKFSNIDKKLINDPYVTTTLTKVIIDSLNKPIPDDIADQANFWKENLNSGGNADQFITMFNEHRTPTDVEDHVMDMFRDEEDGPFTIQAGDLT